MKTDYLLPKKVNNVMDNRLHKVVLILSIFVVLGVFWTLKLTGITMAGEAFCGFEEHIHGEHCVFAEDLEIDEVQTDVTQEEGTEDSLVEVPKVCILKEHVHVASCYSDTDADLETSDDWNEMTQNIATSTNVTENLIAIARSQIGYEESTLNFEVDENNVKHGITRYGQWYGNPYGEWSAMFVGFCLEYSGADEFAINAGPESMRLEWEKLEYYRSALEYAPSVGNIVFIDRDGNGEADSVAIVAEILDEQITVIEGDFEDVVAEVKYSLTDSMIIGYGNLPIENIVLSAEGEKLIAYMEEDFEKLLSTGNNVIVYHSDDSGNYALDGEGNYVDIFIRDDGSIYTSSDHTEMLFWNVTGVDNDGNPKLQNVVTKMYLPQKQTTVSTYDLRKAGNEETTNNQYARAVDYTVWLDGTNGGMQSYGDAANEKYTVTGGNTFILPDTLKSTSEYDYKIRGWYDVTNNKYYLPGESVTVNGNMVFYADWVASTYDIGVFNSDVVNTVSTNEFVTTRMFDYNVLFNVLSSSAKVTVSNTQHKEEWTLITGNNTVPYNSQKTLNYIFRDWDSSKVITYPSGVSSSGPHFPTDVGKVYSGLYTEQIGDLLFNPDTKVIGKEYLGTADHLFQLCLDETDEYYGYYYYDSQRNAASYNQSEERFYVYDYLEQTTESSTTSEGGKYSDFLPLNSPYVTPGEREPEPYTYDGMNGEYKGVEHYMYDATDSDKSDVATNFFFGMSVAIDFYIPNNVGTGGNKDLYGNDMSFEFSGDDDVWVFVDDKLVLDLGGIHRIESGSLNFSTGEVEINGTVDQNLTNTFKTVQAGEHVLTLYYLERGSSMSNCAIYFNLAPRFGFSLEKEDVLTKEALNGAQFSVFTDKECTKPAELWPSKEAHDRGEKPTNVFTVVNGVADMWGLGAGNTYYITETKPPDSSDYADVSGIITVTLDKTGTADYNVEVINQDGSISPGFTVHGQRIDDVTQKAYIVATNAPEWVEEVTDVYARKIWNDNKDHSSDEVIIYLTIKDKDGTVRRLQEATLSKDNNWLHQWTNLPKYEKDGKTLIVYGVEESYVNGYYSKVTETDHFDFPSGLEWKETTSLKNGKTYLLKTSQGYLSTYDNKSDTGYKWIGEAEAKNKKEAQWTITESGGKVKLTNGIGQTITFYYNGGSPTDYFASTGGETTAAKQFMSYVAETSGIKIYYDGENGKDYYLINETTNNHKFKFNTDINKGLVFTPYVETEVSESVEITGYAYEITNTPLTEETSVTVYKEWDYGNIAPDGSHEKAQVTVKLYADGKDTGRSITLSLKNYWTDIFKGLPYKDQDGNIIKYTVVEDWDNSSWIAEYGQVVKSTGDPSTYSITVTNRNVIGISGPELPSTGISTRLVLMLGGSMIMLSSLATGIVLRNKRKRKVM